MKLVPGIKIIIILPLLNLTYDTNLGIKIVPKKGNAVLFYNLLDDGNGDDLSLHAALPVKEGDIT